MKKKAEITCSTFKGEKDGQYTYELTFNQSLEDTIRMQSMAKALDRFDRMRPIWGIIHYLVARPLNFVFRTKWTFGFYLHSWNRK